MSRSDAHGCPLRLLLLISIILLPLASAYSQQRPIVTEDPRVIPNGTVVSEAGFSYFKRARFPVSGLGGDQFSLLVNGLHFSLGPRAEFQMAGVLHNIVRVRENGSGWTNDWGDFSISTKILILPEGTFRPIIGFRPTVVLPNTNNDKGLGTDGTHFFGNVLLGKSVGPAFVFGNFGLGILDDAVRAGAQQDVLSYGIAAVIPLNARLSLLSEVNGLDNPQDNPTPGGEDRAQFRLGAQIRALGGRWDFGGVAGLTRLDPTFGIVFGFTKEFQVWK